MPGSDAGSYSQFVQPEWFYQDVLNDPREHQYLAYLYDNLEKVLLIPPLATPLHLKPPKNFETWKITPCISS